MKYLKVVIIFLFALVLSHCDSDQAGLPVGGSFGNGGPIFNPFNPGGPINPIDPLDPGGPGGPGPVPTPTPIDPGGCEPNCTSSATLGGGTVTYKIYNEAANPTSGYRMYSANIGPENFQVMDGVGNIVPINEIDVPLGTAMSFKFFVHQAWGLQCVSHFEIAADNFSSLSFEDITEEGAYDAVHWGITTSNVGATTLSFTNPECTLDPPDMPISASLGSGSVTYKILSNPANPGAGYQLYTAALGLQNINVFDEFGALIDKNNISFLPGTPISFAFYIGEAWQIQCVREYNITAQNLAGLAFAGIFPVQVYDAVSFDTAIAETGSTSLTYANPGCSI